MSPRNHTEILDGHPNLRRRIGNFKATCVGIRMNTFGIVRHREESSRRCGLLLGHFSQATTFNIVYGGKMETFEQFARDILSAEVKLVKRSAFLVGYRDVKGAPKESALAVIMASSVDAQAHFSTEQYSKKRLRQTNC